MSDEHKPGEGPGDKAELRAGGGGVSALVALLREAAAKFSVRETELAAEGLQLRLQSPGSKAVRAAMMGSAEMRGLASRCTEMASQLEEMASGAATYDRPRRAVEGGDAVLRGFRAGFSAGYQACEWAREEEATGPSPSKPTHLASAEALFRAQLAKGV